MSDWGDVLFSVAKPELPCTCLISTSRSIQTYSLEYWAKVPAAIRKIVAQHVAAHLPAEILAKLRNLHARGASISSDPAFFHSAAAWPSETFAANGSTTESCKPTAVSAAIGTTATSGSSPGSPRRRSEDRRRRSAAHGNSSSISSRPNFSSTAAPPRAFGQAHWPNRRLGRQWPPNFRTLSPGDPTFFHHTAILWTRLHGAWVAGQT
jgi:hypothetical protein